jgi:zinc protease
MQHASLPTEELAKEMDVIRREMDLNQDDPHRRSSRRLFETAYTRSPYRYTVIGYPQVFNQLTREDIVAYYREKYVPNNLFFVVVGDVDAAAVIAQVRDAFAQARPKPLPAVALVTEPPQTAPREVVETAGIELAHAHFAWHIPDLRHPDVPALDVLSVLLGHGRSSRLYQRVREPGLAHSVDAWTYSPGQAGLIGISLVAEADRYEAARDAVLAEAERVQRDGVSEEELAKAVKQFTAAALATRKTMHGQANELGGSWLAAQDLNFTERYLAAVRRVSGEAVQRVARQYLTASNRTLYALLPADTARGRSRGQRTAGPQPSPTEARPSPRSPVRKFDLANGLRLLTQEDRRLPFVEIRAVFLGGVLAEAPDTNGLTHLTSRMLLKGTPTRTAEQIALEIESVGGSLDTYAGNNSFGVSLEVLRSDFEPAMALLADVLLRPSFPGEALERERLAQLAAIRAQNDQVLQQAFRAMRRGLFGERGYGLDPLGTEANVPRFTAADLQSFHRRLVVPNTSVLAVFGDVCADQVRAVVETMFGEWRPGDPAATATEERGHRTARPVIQTRDKQQAALVIGFPGTTLGHPDRYALDLLQEACSDLGSRLFVRIRETLGLAYAVGAQHFAGLAPGYFAFYVSTAPDKVDEVEQQLFAEAAWLRAEGLTAEELARAKAKVIGQKKIARQDLGHVAFTRALDELYGLGFAHSDREDAAFEAVTADQIQAVAAKYLRAEAAVVAQVRPQR